MKYSTKIKVIKNGYCPPKGLYRIVVPYLSSLKKLEFIEKDDELFVFHNKLFYPLDSVFWANEGSEIPLTSISKTKIGAKVKEKDILLELENHYILQNTDNLEHKHGEG
jgi:hypothetical protein